VALTADDLRYAVRALPAGGAPMPNAYIPILLFFLVAVGFAIALLLVAWSIAPQKYSRVKLEPYECGIETVGDARDRYSVRYYLVAMLFVIFDIETVFLFPWAVILDQLALFGLIEMFVFLGILIAGYAYAWRKGALEWA
jgi:NADH-quinone oxidoreductase subunit A